MPRPSPSKMMREHVVASGMVLHVSASLTKKVDWPIKMLSLALSLDFPLIDRGQTSSVSRG